MSTAPYHVPDTKRRPASPPPSYSHPAQHTQQPIYDHYSQNQNQNYHSHQGDHQSQHQGPYARPGGDANINLPPGVYPSNFQTYNGSDGKGRAQEVAYYETDTTGTTTTSGTHTGFDTSYGSGTSGGRRQKKRREKDVATGFCAGCLGACCCCAACVVM